MSKNNILLKEQSSQEGSSYGTTIYVSEDVFNKLMEMDYSGFVSVTEEKFLSLGGMRFRENKSLPDNTILIPDPKEVKRLENERYKKMVEDLKVFERLYGVKL